MDKYLKNPLLISFIILAILLSCLSIGLFVKANSDVDTWAQTKGIKKADSSISLSGIDFSWNNWITFQFTIDGSSGVNWHLKPFGKITTFSVGSPFIYKLF